jgi:transcriptional regulator with XRE-family HTH domain
VKKYEFLEKLRKNLGYSRKKIAEYLEVSPTTIERYEKGKLDFTYKTKYILGICALSGYDNYIFSYNEIKEEYLHYYKLTKFSQKLREILYFLNIEYDDYESFIAKMFYKNLSLIEFDYDLFKRWDIKENLLSQKFDEQKRVMKYISNPEQELLSVCQAISEQMENYKKEIILKELEKHYEEDKINFFASLGFEILLLYIFDFFNVKEFYEDNKFRFVNIILGGESIFINSFKYITSIGIMDIFDTYYEEDIAKLKQLYPTIKKTIEELEKTGKPVTKETIKEFKLELETGGITTSCPEITDPKDQKILELLHYAPPAFKDKIIEKLEKFRDEVEKF